MAYELTCWRKQLRPSLITLIINLSFQQRCFPSLWIRKYAKVIPICKGAACIQIITNISSHLHYQTNNGGFSLGSPLYTYQHYISGFTLLILAMTLSWCHSPHTAFWQIMQLAAASLSCWLDFKLEISECSIVNGVNGAISEPITGVPQRPCSVWNWTIYMYYSMLTVCVTLLCSTAVN